MSNSGWISLHRKIMDDPLYLSEKFTKVHAWIDLLLLANFKDSEIIIRGIRIPLKRGQLAYSEVSLAKRWKWARSTAKRYLFELETRHQIEQQKNNVTTLITILNFDKYQLCDTAKRTPKHTAEHTAERTQINNINKDNKLFLYQEIVDLYHSVCRNFPKIQKLTTSRKNKIAARIKENDFKSKKEIIDFFNEIFRKANESDFLSGINDKNWKCDFDWIFENDKNYLKILECRYQNHENRKNDKRNTNDPREFGKIGSYETEI